MKVFELTPINGRKSFYGKAKAIEQDNGDIELLSYETIVCRIRNGKFQKLWNGYSSTTMNHVNAFVSTYGIVGSGKKWWDSLEIVSE